MSKQSNVTSPRGERVKRREEQLNKEKRIQKERMDLIKCAIFAVACLVCVLIILIDAVLPKKYNVKAGEIAPENILASKDVLDSITYEAAKQAERNKVATIYATDDQKRIDAMNGVGKDFDNLILQRANAISDRDKWVQDNFYYTINDYPIDRLDDFVNRLGSAGNSISNHDMLQIMNIDKADIESMAAAVSGQISDAMKGGLTQEKLLSRRGIISDIFTSDKGNYKDLPQGLRNFARLVVERNLDYNCEPDEQATEIACKEAESKIDQADYKYKKGEVLVAQGKLITSAHIAMITELGMLDDGSIDFDLYFGVGFVALAALLIVALYIIVFEKGLLKAPKKILMLAILIVLSVFYCAVVIKIQPELAQVAIGTILIAVLLKPRVALVVNMAISVMLWLLAIQTSQLASAESASTLVVALISGTVAVFLCNRPMHRMRIMVTGIAIGGAGSIVSIFLGLMFSSDFVAVLIDAAWPLLGGALSAILCIGTLPVWESVFGVLTPTKLLELANPNNPLLRRLAIEAPGTHHHSIVVANLAETGARAIGADAILVRAGAYYHDVGKLTHPEAFTENQSEKQKGYHSVLLPGESAALIKSHPTEGYELAVKNKLPKEIRSIIIEHHGTTVVGYFYAKALEMYEKVNREDFMYPGPKPQSKETAIIMIADSCEAAVRSMPDKSPQNVRAKIDQIIKDRISDGQFDECNITMQELNRVAEEFTNALSGVHHQRIEYPDLKKALQDNKERESANANRADK